MPLWSCLPRKSPVFFTEFFPGGTKIFPWFTGFPREKNPANSKEKVGYIPNYERCILPATWGSMTDCGTWDCISRDARSTLVLVQGEYSIAQWVDLNPRQIHHDASASPPSCKACAVHGSLDTVSVASVASSFFLVPLVLVSCPWKTLKGQDSNIWILW